MYYLAKEYRENTLEGSITYGKAFVFLLYISIIMTFVSAIYTYVLYAYLDPNLIEIAKETAAEEMYSKGMSDDEVEMAMSISEKFITPLVSSISAFFMSILLWAISSLAIAAFVKKNKI